MSSSEQPSTSSAVAPAAASSSERAAPLEGAALFSALQTLTAKILSASPVYSHLLSDLTLEEGSCSPGHVVYIWPSLPAHCLNSHKTLHGAVAATLVDFLGGPVIASTTSDPLSAKRGVSTDISVQYLRDVKEGERVRVVGRAKKVGRRLAWVGVEVWAGEEGKERLCVEGNHTKFIA